ncbi:MAG: hypothetical protein ACRDEA_19865 [Microcystaceae cyanobacterium]
MSSLIYYLLISESDRRGILEDVTFDSTQMLKEPALGWNEFSANVEVHVVPGNHMTMMQQPHVQVLAAQLRASLE